MNDSTTPACALSVVVCTYNNAALLAETLEHLQRQQPVTADFEVLVIDNNCTDDTASVVEKFQAHLPHLRRIIEPNQGQMYARVRGVRESRAAWIAFVDDDNWLAPDWMAAALRLITEKPDCEVFGGKVVIDWEIPPPAVVARRAYAYASTDLGPQPRALLGDERWLLRGAGLVCRKAALERCGWLDWQACLGRAGRGTMAGDDTEIVMRLARAGGEVWYEPACQLQHRITRRRLSWAYLRSLHFGFALSDPILLGFRGKGSLIAWGGRFFMLLLRRTYWLLRHSLKAVRAEDSRAMAVLTWDTLNGAVQGLATIARMNRSQRRAWLGRLEPRAESDTIRVLHVAAGQWYGGMERMIACLAVEGAQSPKMRSVFAVCYPERLWAELTTANAQIALLGPVRTSRPWQWLRAARRLDRVLAQEPWAAVVCHGSWSLALFGICARWRRRPLVLWMHNDTKVRHKNVVEVLASYLRPDLVIANSAYTAASLPLLFPHPPPHRVLACPVSRPPVHLLTAERRAVVRAQFTTPAEAVVIALVGRPEPWKGHAELLAALAQLHDRADWVCWIIGGAFTAEQRAFVALLEARVGELGIAGRVRFIGQRDDVAELLAAADLFCQPNVTPEPFGIVFVEALYAGLPVVTTDHGGGREIVDATCGRLVPPNDPRALAGALEQLLTDADLRRTLSRQAARRGAAVSDPALILPALCAALTELSARPAAGPQSRMASELEETTHG